MGRARVIYYNIVLEEGIFKPPLALNDAADERQTMNAKFEC